MPKIIESIEAEQILALPAQAQRPGLLLTLLFIWMLVGVVTVALYRRRNVHTAGLVPAYMINLSLIHLGGAAIYLVDTIHLYDSEQVISGFREATWGLLAFCIGVTASSLLPPPTIRSHHASHPLIPRVYLMVGLIAYAATVALTVNLPSAISLLSTGQYIFMIGLLLLCREAYKSGHRKMVILSVVGISLLLPFVTLVMQGFIGYGAAAAILILSFVSSMGKPRKSTLVVSVVIVYLGLSVFVAYLQTRDTVRSLVTQQAGIGERSEAVIDAAATFEWFDPDNPVHLEQIDRRLNQNYLVGGAVERLAVTQQFARGETLRDAAISLVPRALWPSKPVSAGSGDLVSNFTGEIFAEGTSVGVGQVLENYVNFGTGGVIVGMFLIGLTIAAIDSRAANRLARDDVRGFTMLFLIGIAFLQVGGSFVEVVASAGASVVLALGLNGALLYRLHSKQPPQDRPTKGPASEGIS